MHDYTQTFANVKETKYTHELCRSSVGKSYSKYVYCMNDDLSHLCWPHGLNTWDYRDHLSHG